MDDKEEIKTDKEEGDNIAGASGDTPEVPDQIVAANSAAERLEKANEETARLEKEKVEGEARRRLGGNTEGAVVAQKEPEKSEDEKANEYADKLEKGEVNPMKDDGFIE